MRKALFEKYGIRDCVVRVDRCNNSNITNDASPKKKLLASKEKLRLEVTWLPASSSVLVNSSEALSTLSMYHEKNGIVPLVARKNVRRQTRQIDVCRSRKS